MNPRPWLTPWRLRVYPRLLLAALGLSLAAALCTGQGTRVVSGRLGGDFAEFYAAGRIALAGDWVGLYDPGRQAAAQADLIPGDPGRFVPFAYPPQFALLHAPLALLPYRTAFVLYLALMAGLLYTGVALACRRTDWARSQVLAVFCGVLFFYPLLRAVLGGQNTPLTLALLAAAFTLDRRDRSFWAGLCLGGLLYKPHFGLGLLVLFALAGRWRTAGWGLVAAVAVAAGDTALCGPDWVRRWLAYAHWVVTTSMAMEGEMAVSVMGISRLALAPWPRAAQVVGAVLAGGCLACLAWVFWRGRGRPLGLNHLGLAGAGLVLAAPHAYYYDAGLLVFAGLALPRSRLPAAGRIMLGLWLAGLSQLGARALGASPLFAALLAGYGLMLAALGRDAGQPSAAAPPGSSVRDGASP